MEPSGEIREENEPSEERCALIGDMDTKQPSTSLALVPYRGHSVNELSWEADSAWSVHHLCHYIAINDMVYMTNIKCRSLRMLKLMVEGARLKMLMAWCSTLGGAHSSLGEHNISHVSLHHKITI